MALERKSGATRFCYCCVMDMKLLDLTLEYQTAKGVDGGVDEMLLTARTPEEIAAEYGQALKQFLADESDVVRAPLVGMESASVGDFAELIHAKAEVIANATVEADITEALDQIEAAAARMRALL